MTPRRWLSLPALLLASAAVLAQTPAQPPALDPAKNKLDAILVQWEKAMGGINTLYTQVKRTSQDKIFMTNEVYEGEARYVKPNKARLWLINSDPKKQGEFEKLVLNGQTAYKWEPTKKEIHIYTFEAPKGGQVSDENVASMLFGMKAAEAKKRYDLTYLQSDQYYHYIQVLPRDPADKAEFTRARLVLTITTGLPAQIWFEMPNGNETTWDFKKVMPNAQLDLKDFDQPNEPGWQLKKIANPQQDRIVRPAGK
jgi:TIGR03009 family protein